MDNQTSESTSIWNINLRFLYSGFIMALGYGYWLLSSKEWYAFGILAVMCGIAGVAYFIQTIFLLRSRIRNDSKVKQYTKQGERPKGDKPPGREDLDKKDMLRKGMSK
ncbi:MAG: hypothetical protein GY761_16455 [Hyphomicrobiales bacterium]|nr:hypothetical protein [Hyphomicrobiales bacterium]